MLAAGVHQLEAVIIAEGLADGLHQFRSAAGDDVLTCEVVIRESKDQLQPELNLPWHSCQGRNQARRGTD